MATAESKLSVKLLIDTKNKEVVFAEVEKDFVDFLFHILTLPVGTVTKLLKEKGMNGCLHNIYESVENLNDTYIQSKDMLLEPKCPVRISSVPLPLHSDIPTLAAIYLCSANCNYSYGTVDPCSTCPCCLNSIMSRKLTCVPAATEGFVKEVVKYMVMDDLVVKPMSAVSSITALKDYCNVKDVVALQEEVVHFGKEEALKLLKSTFESNEVLTSVFMSRVKAEK